MKKALSLGIIVIIICGWQFNINPIESPGIISINEDLADQLTGAWEHKYEDESGQEMTIVAIVTDNFYSASVYNLEGKKFFFVFGGSWKIMNQRFIETYEFHTADTSKIGGTESNEISIQGDTLIFTEIGMKWTRIDDGTPGDLAGAWLITGRKRDGEISRRTPGARKTMKILSGTRFQWIAYNSDTGDFFGTGGGTYTTKDGKYMENIEFFSRDSSRIGASLEFDYELVDGEWHHSGLSSRGDPLYEIWTLRNESEDKLK